MVKELTKVYEEKSCLLEPKERKLNMSEKLWLGTFNDKWNSRFMEMAKMVAGWSKDPRTKCGCVIVRPDKTIAGIGYNGLPRGIADTEDSLRDRDIKHSMIIHAEDNAILNCRDATLQGHTVFVWPIMPCSRCMSKLIQVGIKTVVFGNTARDDDEFLNFRLSKEMAAEAGVEMIEI